MPAFLVGRTGLPPEEIAEKELERAGNLVKVVPYTNKIGCSERTHAVIEPKLSTQWFLKMEKISKPALRQ